MRDPAELSRREVRTPDQRRRITRTTSDPDRVHLDLGQPAGDRFVLSRTHELVGVVGSVVLSAAAVGLAVAAG